MKSQKIYVVGDIHGDFGGFNAWLDRVRPDIVIQCGDFGFWPGHDKFELSRIKPHGAKIYWLDGNHENHEALNLIQAKGEHCHAPIEMEPDIFYMPRGSTMRLLGQNCLFMGGATSIDRNIRTPGYDWFAEENIRQIDMDLLPLHEKIDTVFSHTFPRFLFQYMSNFLRFNLPCVSQDALRIIFGHFQPKRWYFAHFHHAVNGTDAGCEWTCLNMLGQSGWAVQMEGGEP